MTINITCDDNYELASTLPIECNNGTWTVEPKCEPARCKILPDPPLNGMVVVCILILQPSNEIKYSKSTLKANRGTSCNSKTSLQQLVNSWSQKLSCQI